MIDDRARTGVTRRGRDGRSPEGISTAECAVHGDQIGLRVRASRGALVLALEEGAFGVEHLKEVGATLYVAQTRQLGSAGARRRRGLEMLEPLARFAVRHDR